MIQSKIYGYPTKEFDLFIDDNKVILESNCGAKITSEIWRKVNLQEAKELSRAENMDYHEIDFADRLLKRTAPMRERLEYVAHVYNQAQYLGLYPNKHVCLSFGSTEHPLARATASKWIAKAREKGLIDD